MPRPSTEEALVLLAGLGFSKLLLGIGSRHGARYLVAGTVHVSGTLEVGLVSGCHASLFGKENE